jgi:hypothetical protein
VSAEKQELLLDLQDIWREDLAENLRRLYVFADRVEDAIDALSRIETLLQKELEK